ncbi:hypothetical protein ACFXPJ_07225 [Streptomyces goshikiensis]
MCASKMTTNGWERLLGEALEVGRAHFNVVALMGDDFVLLAHTADGIPSRPPLTHHPQGLVRTIP